MASRPGTIGAQREALEDQEVTTVRAVHDMSQGDFITHARARHRNLRYVTKNEHEALHRLRPPDDHVHENHIEEPPQPETQTVAATKPEPKPRTRASR